MITISSLRPLKYCRFLIVSSSVFFIYILYQHINIPEYFWWNLQDRFISLAFRQQCLTWNVHFPQRTSPKYDHRYDPNEKKAFKMKGYEKYFISAYLDSRFNYPFVRVLGFEPLHESMKVYCLLYYSDTSSMKCVGPARRELIDLGSNQGYLAAYSYKCYLCGNEMQPSYVQLTDNKNCTAQNYWIPVTYFPVHSEQMHKFSVCVPARYNFEDAAQIVEFIEFNRYFGATSITIYNHSISDRLDQLLYQYVKEGLVTIVKWDIPSSVLNKTHYYGQNLVVNDCVYRHIGNTQFLAITDTDELIVSHSSSLHWKDIKQIFEQRLYGSFLFRHVTFAKHDFENAKLLFWNREKPGHYEPVPFQFQLRDTEPLEENIRSKIIVKPSATEYVGVHQVWKLLPGYKNYVVPPNIALLHHYRREDSVPSPNVIDNTLIKLRKPLEDAIERRLSKNG